MRGNRSDAAASEIDDVADEFESLRPRLFGIAYRMLGSTVEAEDIVQDAWIRWQGTDRTGVRSPAAFLTTMTTRLSINVATSSRLRRETYIGPWLPEPVLTGADPELGAENTEALEVGILLLMERLTPMERAVYLLHEAFDYPYREIGEVIGTTEANARQLSRRARQHLTESSGTRVTVAEKNRLLRSFLAAAQSGDVQRAVPARYAAEASEQRGARAHRAERFRRVRLPHGRRALHRLQHRSDRARHQPDLLRPESAEARRPALRPRRRALA